MVTPSLSAFDAGWLDRSPAELAAGSRYDAAHRALDALGGTGIRYRPDWADLIRRDPAGRAVRDAAGAERAEFVLAAFERLAAFYRAATTHDMSLLSSTEYFHKRAESLAWMQHRAEATDWQSFCWLARAVAEVLLRGDVALDGADAERLTDLLLGLATSTNRPPYAGLNHWVPLKPALQAIARHAERAELTGPVRRGLSALADHLKGRGDGDPKLVPLIEETLGRRAAGEPATAASPGEAAEAWAAAILADLRALPEAERFAWSALLKHAEALSTAEPSGKWLAAARDLTAKIGPGAFRPRVTGWLDGLRKGRDVPIGDTNGSILRGLLWYCAAVDDPALIPVVARAVGACLVKIPQLGLRSRKAGNAGLHALAGFSDPAGLSELVRLSLSVKHPQANADIEKAIGKASVRHGTTRADLEELSVPDHGLDASGVHRRQLGEFAAELVATGTAEAAVRWFGPDGAALKGAPAAVRRDHAADAQALAAEAKVLGATLAAQRRRLERLLRDERDWSYPVWLGRYPEHSVVGLLARRLIWEFRTGGRRATGFHHDGRLVDRHGLALDGLDDETRVGLWHPLADDANTILQWRMFLEERELTQPFKQAHREVYVLTDAERTTATYSNRFAGHILRQHQLRALAEDRGWRFRLFIDGADAGSYPQLDLPQHGCSVRFAVEPVENGETSHALANLFVASDAVRFVEDGWRDRPLATVPARLFSEVMRDVDLFVGVASVGADPTWGIRDGDAHADYWRGYSFGELGESARSRRDTLSRLLPRLKIADRCTLEERFLVVRGKLRTYRIHLGSGNVQMSPDDRYLCLVQGAAKPGDAPKSVCLPFEEDRTLSLILSKAFMLAEDAFIKDPTVTRQIRAE